MVRKKIMMLFMVIAMIVTLFAELSVKTKTAKADDRLVLHLKFDGDLTDSSGRNNNAECTYGNITFEEGIFGKSALFNGKSYLEILDNDSLDLNNFTISLWAYKTKNMISDDVPYVYKEEDENCWASPYKLYEYHDNKPTTYLHDTTDDTEMDQFEIDGKPVDIRKWFFLTVTYNGSEVRMYEDGVLTKKRSVTGAPANTMGNLYIGMNDGDSFFNGYMDDLRIYDKGLSAQEVSTLYKEGLDKSPHLLTQKDSLVAHFKFNEDYKDSSTFGNNADLVAGKVTFVDGVNGKAAKLSKGTYLEVPNSESIDFDQGFSVTGWANINSEDVMALLNKTGVSTTAASDDYAYQLRLNYDYYDLNYVPFGDQPGPQYSRITFEKSLLNKWVHFAVTFDTQEIRWYSNGKLIQKAEVSDYIGSDFAHSTGNLMIGSDGEYFFKGAIDELKLYNYKLSAKEVEADANNIDSLSVSEENKKGFEAMKVNNSITLATSRKYIETGKTVLLKSGITYTSSNKKIFTVDSKGVIKAVKKGSATLKISHGGITKSYKVTVK